MFNLCSNILLLCLNFNLKFCFYTALHLYDIYVYLLDVLNGEVLQNERDCYRDKFSFFFFRRMKRIYA